MDVLTDVLSALELDSELYFRATFEGRFAVAVPPEAARIRFHLVTAGHCWIGVEEGPALCAGPGDLVLVPHGAAHVLADAPAEDAAALASVLEEAESPSQAEIVYGSGGDARAHLVCGHFAYRSDAAHPLFASLPPLLHVRAGEGGRYEWLDALLRHLDEEARERRVGSGEIVRRLSEILLVEVLRAYVDRGEPAGALSALGDPAVRRALDALHAAPGDAWTLETLAARAGASRSVLSERFRLHLGTSPMRYLTHWRLEKARLLLDRRELSVGEIGAAVGYASEAAFSRAFKERHGEAPGRLRAAAEHGRAAPGG